MHNGWENFYNEPPFAERLARLTRRNRVPETAQPAFVGAVVTAATGNGYGVSRAASPFYNEMVKSFSPKEIMMMLDLTKGTSTVAGRIRSDKGCERRFRALVGLIDPKSVPTTSKSLYSKWVSSALAQG